MTVLSVLAFGGIKVTLTLIQFIIAGFGISIGIALFKLLQNKLYTSNLEKEVTI